MTGEWLPSLLFGERTALNVNSVNEMQDMVANVKGWRCEYGTASAKTAYRSKVAIVGVNGTKITSVAHTPMHTWVQSDHSSTLFIPITGPENRSRINGKDYDYGPGHTAVFAPEGVRSGEGALRSMLMIDIDKQRLRETVRIMTGKPLTIPGDLNAPITISLRAGSVKFDQMLRHVCSMADQFVTAPALLNRSGLDDVIYRTMSMMFAPAAFLPSPADIVVNERHTLNAICDFLMAHISEPVTLTDLERFSGLSARTLQYVFAKKTGMSPMVWLKQQRLIKAQELLRQPGAVQSITTLAMHFCFSSPSRFAADYRRQFGCLPSQEIA